ncbi:hypothetical protein WMY93_016926 [Mugilogobius chulae]|uniref:Uncharacterized protein n=1 Tax=Mugilogobius chulae TaxID=88201 RepID=A0AAW0NR30_9GOBI
MHKRHVNIHQCLTKQPHELSAYKSLDWESAESDTESLAQERAYQQQLQLNLSNSSTGQSVCFNNNVHASHQTDEGEDEDEHLWAFDSLEMSNSQSVRKMAALHAKSQVFPDDPYSHQRYDASPKIISKGMGLSHEGPLISVDESFLNKDEKPRRNRKEVVKKDEYMLITSTRQQLATTPQNFSYDQPYLLHPQNEWNNVVSTPPPLQSNILQFKPSKENYDSKNVSSELTEEPGTHAQSYTEATTEQQVDKTANVQKPLGDIVERNKLTLGRNAKYGSYAKAHARKTPQYGPKVSPMRMGKKAERKEDLNPAGPRQPLAPGVKAEQKDSLSSPLTKAAVKSLDKPPSSSQPLSPAIHLNINLNTTPLLPLLSTQQGRDSIINLSYRKPHLNPQLHIALTPQQTSHRNPLMVYQDALHTDVNLESISAQWQRLATSKDQLLCVEEEEDQRESLKMSRQVRLCHSSQAHRPAHHKAPAPTKCCPLSASWNQRQTLS